MQYREFTPNDQLARWIRCYWILEGVSPGRDVERVFPDGYMEMIVHLGDPFESLAHDGTFEPQARVTLHGQLRQFALLRSPPRARTVGIRFQPAGAGRMAAVPLHELCDRPIAFDAFEAGASRQLAERLAEAATDRALVRTIDRFLLARFDSTRTTDPIVEHCVQAIEQARGRIRIDRLATAVDLSPRQLQRRFDAQVGLTPKTFATIVRFQRVFRLVEQENVANLTQAALAADYFDQAHFIRSFSALTGLTPSRFFREPGCMAPLFAGR